MKPHQLKTQPKINRRRVGRGIAAGGGKTAGRGTKGQGSRSGVSLRPTFEGGQNPLTMRLPKQLGFTSRRGPTQLIKTGQLNRFKTSQTVTMVELRATGLIERLDRPVRLVKKGKLTKAVKLEIHAASQSAIKEVSSQKGNLKLVVFKAGPRSRGVKPKS